VLDDDDRRLVEALHQAPGGLGVVEVQVRQLLATVLDGVVPPAPLPRLAVPRSLLVRVLAVAELLDPLQPQVERRCQRFAGDRAAGVGTAGLRFTTPAGQPRGNGRVVRRGPGESGLGQIPLRGSRQRPRRAELREHRSVLRRVHDHADVSVVLGRGSDHGRTPDVDQLDARLRGERIEVHDEQADGVDAELLELGSVLGLVDVRQEPGVDGGMECDDAVPEDGREARQLGHVGDREPRVDQRTRRPSARHQAPAQLVQPRGQLDDAALVVDGQQGRAHAPTTSAMISG
jgi:hypothetical protein